MDPYIIISFDFGSYYHEDEDSYKEQIHDYSSLCVYDTNSAELLSFFKSSNKYLYSICSHIDSFSSQPGVNTLILPISKLSLPIGAFILYIPSFLSNKGLFLIALCFLDPGDTYLTNVPAYLGAVQAFGAIQANCESIPVNEEGIDIDKLRRNIDRLRRTNIYPKFIYTVPTFSNPSGETISVKQRKELLDIASEYDFLIVEDDPYSDLIFEGDFIPPIKSFDEHGRVIYVSTFSKILAPGFRLGWTIASREILEKLVLAKQANDLCTNVFSQYVAYEYMNKGYLDKQIEKIKTLYKRKRDVMLKALKDYFPEGVKWNVPKGGMFIWITLPKKINAHVMFQKAIAKKVAYVVGDAFYPDGGNYNTMRLNFSYSEDEKIVEGIKRLAEVIKEELETSYEKKEYFPEGV